MKKILPMEISQITSHPGTAALFGILQSFGIGKEWIYTNFIMTETYILQEEQYKQHLDFVMDPPYEIALVCPYVLRSEWQGEAIRTIINDDIVNIVEKAINIDNYVFLLVDEDKFLHIGHPFFHELFIYGYDNEEKFFYVGDFTFHGKYSLERISYDELKEAYEETYTYNNGGSMALWKINAHAKYDFDVKLVYKCLQEYLVGISYNQRCVKCYFQAPDNICGIYTYDFLVLHMYEHERQMLKCLHNLYDHKKLMLERLIYMEDKEFIPKTFSKQFKKITSDAGIICNLYIKYELTLNTEYLDKIVIMLLEIKNNEKRLYSKILENSKYMN